MYQTLDDEISVLIQYILRYGLKVLKEPNVDVYFKIKTD